MKDKTNIAELLKDCPRGMELDCTMYENLYFDGIDKTQMHWYPIKCYTVTPGLRTNLTFSKFGEPNIITTSKCVIFPKGKTTWRGFVPPCQFKDGDIVTLSNDFGIHTFIYNATTDGYSYGYYAIITSMDNFKVSGFCSGSNYSLATEGEKQKLFQAIKDNGCKWNAKTKTLEKLIKPKFKVGDRIVHKQEGNPFTITEITDGCYKGGTRYAILITQQDNFELTPNKFDITTLKPYDKVLVRDNDKQMWVISFFSHRNGLETYKYSCINGSGYAYCIPYEANKELLGTTNDCDDFYKTWEK